MQSLIAIGGWLVVASGVLLAAGMLALVIQLAFVRLRGALWEVDVFLAFALDRHGKRNIAVELDNLKDKWRDADGLYWHIRTECYEAGLDVREIEKRYHEKKAVPHA